MLFQLVQVVYWLSLSTWFGGILFIGVAAQVIFRTMQESNPLLPHVLSVNLEGQHGTLLAGTIIGNLISALTKVELACAVALFVALGAQWCIFDLHNSENFISILIRSALYVAATAIVIYHWRVLWPQTSKFRQEFIDNADDPDKANPALEKFNGCQRESSTLVYVLAGLLCALVLVSVSVRSPATTYTPVTHTN